MHLGILQLDCLLMLCKIELALLKDYNQYLMAEEGMVGGIFQCTIRYTKSNNK